MQSPKSSKTFKSFSLLNIFSKRVPKVRLTSVSPAFTIVELLVVIVVIGILATITIVAYRGITQKATEVAITADLKNVITKFKLFQVENSSYPTNEGDPNNTTHISDCATAIPATGNLCLKLSNGNTYGAYYVDNTVTPNTFCLTVKSTNNTKKSITQDGIMSDVACTYPFPVTLVANTPAPTTDTIYLSWPQVTNAQSFVLERATSADFATNKTLLTAPAPTATTYSSTGLSQGTTYYYRMKVTINGDASNWGTVSATTRAVYTLTVNTGTGGTATGGGTYDSGATPTIAATPNNSLYTFNAWTGDTGCNGIASHNITMDSNKICTASFTLDPNWIAVGTQIWAKANLNVGTRIDSGSYVCGSDIDGYDIYCVSGDQTNNAVLEKYCYDNTESNCTTYGALYQWNEAMQYVITAGAQGICPAGSHIPTDNEWKILEVQLGMTQAQADGTGYRGTDQGTQLKPGGVSGLNMPLAGFRSADGSFYYLSSDVYLWASSESGTYAWSRGLFSGSASVYRPANNGKGDGFSVRCLGN
jgi:uncharacterized protein (TIGR02145 family)/prepilin-type N-terminal cleavage/methylation domain-containing protein